MQKHPSEPFNPQISNTFFRAGLIEAWGRGTLKIINECKKHKIPPPVFKYESGFYLEMNTGNKKNGNRNVTDNVTQMSPKIDEVVLNLLKKNNIITTDEISNVIGKTKRTVLRQIEKLKTEGLIERVGSSKGGHWKILKDKK